MASKAFFNRSFVGAPRSSMVQPIRIWWFGYGLNSLATSPNQTSQTLPRDSRRYSQDDDDSCCKQAISQLSAFSSPFCGMVSVIAIFHHLTKSPEFTLKLNRVGVPTHEGVGSATPSSSTSLTGWISISISPSFTHPLELTSLAHGRAKYFVMAAIIGSSLPPSSAGARRMYFVFQVESVPQVH
jgi:hypothetical protein